MSFLSLEFKHSKLIEIPEASLGRIKLSTFSAINSASAS